MKMIGLFVIATGVALSIPAALLSLIAFSDAGSSCPGNQCSDAISTGILGAIASLLGLGLIGGGWFLIRRHTARTPVTK